MLRNFTIYENQLNKTDSFREKLLYYVIFPAILFVVTILPINRGIDISDTMYSLTGNVLFTKAEGSWNLFMAYYLANFVGFVFTKLPFGHTMVGINFYTSLIVYATAMLVYLSLGKRKQISFPVLFLGELIAISFCWCPTTVLYNYLSYLLWTMGLLLLRSMLFSDSDRKGKKGRYFLAGAILGISVFVKFPNITVAIMILPVFYHAFLTKKKASILWKETGLCVAGFLSGFALLFLLMEGVYGKGTYFSMVRSLFTMTETATDYQSGEMILSILQYYKQVLPFVLGMGLAVAAGIVMLSIAGKLDEKKNTTVFCFAGRIVYAFCVPVLFRLFYGRGLFGTDYRDTFAIIFIGTVFLWLSLIVSVFTMVRKDSGYTDKVDALMLVLLILITPLGSNNGVYPVMDNLFLVIPLTISFLCKRLRHRKTEKTYPIAIMFTAFTALMLIQGILFHSDFSFKGQDDGKLRDTKIENNVILKGMVTNEDRAKQLEAVLGAAGELMDKSPEKSLLTYGNIPGFFFLLKDSVPVLPTTWPDLDSFATVTLESNLKAIRGQVLDKGMEQPMIILTREVYENMQGLQATRKEALLKEFMDMLHYDMMFENDSYLIFQ